MAPHWPIYPADLFFFGANYCYDFHLPIGSFHCAKFKNILTEDLELSGCAILGAQNGLLALKMFFWKIININLIYLLAPFIVHSFKKVFLADPEL